MEVLELEDQPRDPLRRMLFLNRQRKVLEEFSRMLEDASSFKVSVDVVGFARTYFSPLTVIVGNEFYTVHLARDGVLVRRTPKDDGVIIEYTDADKARRQCKILGITLEKLLDRIAYMKTKNIYGILIEK